METNAEDSSKNFIKAIWKDLSSEMPYSCKSSASVHEDFSKILECANQYWFSLAASGVQTERLLHNRDFSFKSFPVS